MYFYSKPPESSNKPTLNKMSKETAPQIDAFSVGTHCQLSTCNKLDFLPWTCDRCKLKLCEEHRTYEAHQCKVSPPTPKQSPSASSSTSPSLTYKGHSLFTSQTCFAKDCKTVLNTTTSPATRCVCGQLFCLKHRHPSDHVCPGAPAQKSALLQNSTMTKETLLLKLKEWSQKRKSSNNDEKSKAGGIFKGLMKGKSNTAASSAAQRGLDVGRLRREAKGDTKISEQDRIYFHGEGPPNLNTSLTSAAQVLRKPVFVSKEWSNGKVLDRLADTLGVQNQNNRTSDQEKRLQLFHIESGTLLEMDKKFGQVVKNGDTVVIARGW